VKVAAAQISCALGDFDANMGKIRQFAASARESGAKLVVFPEMIDTGYSMIQKHARSWEDGAVTKLQKIARELSIAIVAGISDRDGNSIFNAQVFVSAQGEVLAKIAKRISRRQRRLTNGLVCHRETSSSVQNWATSKLA
jgi:predicted amidohydrolase